MNILATLLLCGLMGLLGQGVRAAIGLKSASRVPSAQADQQTAFSTAYFTLSLMIGFIAGVLAGLVIGVKDLLNVDPGDMKVLLGIAASGYVGADFIENAMSIFIPPATNAPAIQAAPNAQTQPTGTQAVSAAINANTMALTSAVQRLAAVSAQIAPTTTFAVPAVVTDADTLLDAAAVPPFGAALHHVAPSIDLAKWEPALTKAFQKFALNNNPRIAAAIGQFLVEAGESFAEVVENMNYSAGRMVQVWPSRFPTEADAEPYAHNPQKLANFVYADRLGNGNEASGDGYRFRGRGLIQLTGRDEYAQFGAAVGMTADQVSSFCETPEGAAISGCWYLSAKGCLPFADSWDLAAITRRVNGVKMLDHAKRVKFSNAMLEQLNN
jgi:predicted chitinase